MSRPVTIRVQKVKKNRIRERLFFFLFIMHCQTMSLKNIVRGP